MSASFAWGQWSKPGAQALHRATPAILSDLRKLEACRALAALPEKARIVLAAPDALRDAHGRPLPETLAREIARRADARCGVESLAPPPEERIEKPYADSTEAHYLSWSEKRGHFKYPLVYPRLEARRVKTDDGWLVAVVNHATEGGPVKAKLPWLPGNAASVTDLTAQGARVDPDTEQAFAPLDVRVFRYLQK